MLPTLACGLDTLEPGEIDSDDLSGKNFAYTAMGGVDLSHKNLRNVDFTGTELVNANLSYADLRSVDLERAQLLGADFTGATLDDKWAKLIPLLTTLLDANLEGAIVTQAQLHEAHLRCTKMPDGTIYDEEACDNTLPPP